MLIGACYSSIVIIVINCFLINLVGIVVNSLQEHSLLHSHGCHYLYRIARSSTSTLYPLPTIPSPQLSLVKSLTIHICHYARKSHVCVKWTSKWISHTMVWVIFIVICHLSTTRSPHQCKELCIFFLCTLCDRVCLLIKGILSIFLMVEVHVYIEK